MYIVTKTGVTIHGTQFGVSPVAGLRTYICDNGQRDWIWSRDILELIPDEEFPNREYTIPCEKTAGTGKPWPANTNWDYVSGLM